MRIVHVNFSDSEGGAAIAVKRTHELLLREGIDSLLLVIENKNNFTNTYSLRQSLLTMIKTIVKKTLSRQLKYIFKTDNRNTHSLNLIPSNLVKKINELKPDYVNLNWIGNETISISDISKIKSPVMWTLHDMWPFCGAEHYSNNQRYITGYTKLNKPINDSGIDINKIIYNKKIKYYKNISKIICSSDWIYNCAKESFLFKDKKLKQIPLFIDSKFWKPLDKKFSKNSLDINEDQKVILFGADNFISNERKGFKFLSEVFKKFDIPNEYKILLFGCGKEHNFNHINKNIINLGLVRDEYTLRLLYSASDVVVVPSQIEAFGQVAYEAIHCGSPCVVFQDTGLASIIDHEVNGYIAKKNSVEDFTSGIKWCLNNKDLTQKSININALKRFNYKNIVNDYINFITKQ